MALARSEGSTQRFYTMSAQIRLERQAYYAASEATQKGDLDITAWLNWFVNCLDRAFDGAEATLGVVRGKANFWEDLAGQALSECQIKVVNRMLDGFEGNLTTSKWAALTKASSDTALRDITDLVEGGGRTTSYSLVD